MGGYGGCQGGVIDLEPVELFSSYSDATIQADVYRWTCTCRSCFHFERGSFERMSTWNCMLADLIVGDTTIY